MNNSYDLNDETYIKYLDILKMNKHEIPPILWNEYLSLKKDALQYIRYKKIKNVLYETYI